MNAVVKQEHQRKRTLNQIPVALGEKSIPVTETGCFLWMGSTDSGGYGVLRFEGKNHKAHRLSWIASNGPIPDGMCVLHKCDVPQCINPSHLFLGTQQENIADMVSKGRARTGGSSRSGHLHPLAKLTKEQADCIRRSHAAGESQHSMSRRFNVSPITINRLVRNISWRNL